MRPARRTYSSAERLVMMMARPITAWISAKIGCPGRRVKLGCGGGYLVSHPLVGWGARCF